MPDTEKSDANLSAGRSPSADEPKRTGDPDAPPSAATDTLGKLMIDEAEAREAQASREQSGGATKADDQRVYERRKRAYAIWEQEGRPEGRHDDHWRAAGGDEAPEPGTAPWTEGP